MGNCHPEKTNVDRGEAEDHKNVHVLTLRPNLDFNFRFGFN